MRKLIERNAIDEDFRKDVYQSSTTVTQSSSVGFKKREVKDKKKRKAEVSDGEKDDDL